MPTDLGSSNICLEADVLVLGTGGAGLRAAIEACRTGADVLVVSKMPAGTRNCTSAAWGALTYAPDSQTDELFRQVVETGGFLSNQDLVATFVEQTPGRIRELTELGIAMDVLDDAERESQLGLIKVQGDKRNTGDGLTHGLRAAAERMGVRFADQVMVSSLSLADGRVTGAIGVHLGEGRLVAVTAKAVVIATGGGACMYARTDNPPGATADGIALAYAAGAELVDLECVSFTVPADRLSDILCADAPLNEDLLRIGTAHYFLGGIRIDQSARTTVPGLFAAGEVTGGLFGAARLGGTAMADTIVFGAIAGAEAAREATNCPTPGLDNKHIRREGEALRAMLSPQGRPAGELTTHLRNLMWRNCGTMRDRASIERTLSNLGDLPASTSAIRAEDSLGLREGVEYRNMLVVAQLLAEATLVREETRGCFWRMDFPEPDTLNGLRNTFQWQSKGLPHCETRPAVMSRFTTPTPPQIGAGCFDYLPTVPPLSPEPLNR